LKNEMMQLDILATNDWERPIYYVSGGAEGALDLEDYFQNDGYAYRLVQSGPREEISCHMEGLIRIFYMII